MLFFSRQYARMDEKNTCRDRFAPENSPYFAVLRIQFYENLSWAEKVQQTLHSNEFKDRYLEN